MTLYEITTTATKETGEIVTIQEASKLLGRTVGSLYGAASEERMINGKYYLHAVDRTLSGSKDLELLMEYDLVRQQLMRAKK